MTLFVLKGQLAVQKWYKNTKHINTSSDKKQNRSETINQELGYE